MQEEKAAPAVAQSKTAVLRESVEISAAQNPDSLTAANQAAIEKGADGIVIRAEGEDPQVTFAIRAHAGRPLAIYIDLESPEASALELFYVVRDTPFSPDNVISAPTRAGRNRILLPVNDTRATGAFRLDPGQIPGEYRIRSIVALSDTELSVIRPARPQAELAAAFEASPQATFAARTAEEFAAFRAIKDATLKPGADGLTIEATGPDSSLLLPAFEIKAPAIVKLVITAPAETALQMFYNVRGTEAYAEARSVTQKLVPGENTVYLELTDPETSGALRLDPGVPNGAYILKEIEVRNATGATP